MRGLTGLTAAGLLLAGGIAEAQHVIVRGEDTGAYMKSFDGTRWTDWVPLGGEFTSGFDACTDARGNVHIVGVGTDGAPWYMRITGGTPGGWRSLEGQSAAAPAVACSGAGAHVFVHGTNNHLFHRAVVNGEPSGPWTPLGPELRGAPDAASASEGQLDVVYRGTDDAFWYLAFAGGSWQPPRPLGGQFTSDPSITPVARNGRTYLEVFGRGTDNALWHGGVEPSGPTAFVKRGGSLAGAPDAASSGDQRMEIVIRASDNSAMLLRFDRGWSDWQPLGGRMISDPAITRYGTTVLTTTDPAPAASARFRVYVTGFRVNRETVDDVLNRDGWYDEVVLRSAMLIVDRNGNRVRQTLEQTSPIIGEVITGQRRLRGGSGTDLGGLRAGDTYPRAIDHNVPMPPTSASVLFEGVLTSGQQAAVVVPTLWEWDDSGWIARYYQEMLAQMMAALPARLASLLANPPPLARDVSSYVKTVGELGVNIGLWGWGDNIGERPIGMQPTGQYRSAPTFDPKALVLTYEIADYIARTGFDYAERRLGASGGPRLIDNGPQMPGLITLFYADMLEHKGDYTLFIRVERCPSLDSCGS
jgi:hypothetical protein